MTMLQNVGVNTEPKRRSTDGQCGRSSSLKLKERNVKHTRINNIKDLNDIYIYGEMLGRGVFGTVVEITDKSTKQVWALKIVDKRTTKGTKINTIENEIKILRMVNHPHIVYLERTFESYKHIYLVIERCTTELANILKMKKKFSESEARKVMDHLSSAIAYLHKYEIIHRDLKMENILTAPNPNDPSDELYIKVSDFGLGIIKSCNRPDQMLSDRCGTLTYMVILNDLINGSYEKEYLVTFIPYYLNRMFLNCKTAINRYLYLLWLKLFQNKQVATPEIISRASYSQQCDVWAMGVICYLILTGHYPFFSKNENVLISLICNDDLDASGFTADSEAVHLITKMLDKNPALRISAAEVCRHPWIRGNTIGSSSPNVLDMMQLWRSEMMVQPTTDNGSDWAQAFSSLQISNASSSPQEINKSVQTKSRPLIPNVSEPTNRSSSKTKIEKKFPTKSSISSRPSQTTCSYKNVANKNFVIKMGQLETKNQVNDRALNVKGKNTKLIRIGKVRKESTNTMH